MSVDAQRWIDTWNTRDGDAIAGLCADDVVVNAVVLGIQPRRYEGRDGVRDWIHDVRQRFRAESRVDRLTQLDEGAMIVEGVLVVADSFDQPREQSFALLVRLRGELAVWIGTFLTPGEARDAYARGLA